MNLNAKILFKISATQIQQCIFLNIMNNLPQSSFQKCNHDLTLENVNILSYENCMALLKDVKTIVNKIQYCCNKNS